MRDADLTNFSASEIAIVTHYIDQFWGLPAHEVSAISHQTKAWRLTHNQQEVPYGMAVVDSDDPTEEDYEWLERVVDAELGSQ